MSSKYPLYLSYIPYAYQYNGRRYIPVENMDYNYRDNFHTNHYKFETKRMRTMNRAIHSESHFQRLGKWADLFIKNQKPVAASKIQKAFRAKLQRDLEQHNRTVAMIRERNRRNRFLQSVNGLSEAQRLANRANWEKNRFKYYLWADNRHDHLKGVQIARVVGNWWKRFKERKNAPPLKRRKVPINKK